MRRFLSDRRGGVALVVVAAFGVIVAFAALAVDLGYLFLKTRQLQGVADLAAIAAARDLDHARAAAEATAQANGWRTPLEISLTTGAYVPDPATPASRRYQAGADPADAVKVTVSGDVDLFFGQAILGRPTTRVSRTATAAQVKLAAFSLGTRLASVDRGAANALLTALTGGKVSLSVMDYNSLAGADVDLLRYTEALATRLDAEGVSFDTVLSTDISTGVALEVLAKTLEETGEAAAVAPMKTLAAAQTGTRKARLDRLVDLGPYAGQDHVVGADAGVKVGALDMANAILLLAGEGRQVKLDLGAGVPGLADAEVWLAIGERPNNTPWLTVAADGSQVIRTAQMRLYVKAGVGPGRVLGTLGVAKVELPVLIELAESQARLSSIACRSGAVTLEVKPSVGSLAIGGIDGDALDDFRRELDIQPAPLVSTLFVKVSGRAEVRLGGDHWRSAYFSRADIASGAVKTVSTRDIGQAATASLLEDLDLRASVGGLALGIGSSTVNKAVASALSDAAAPVDGLIDGLTDLLGVGLGEADVRVGGLRCHDAALVA